MLPTDPYQLAAAAEILQTAALQYAEAEPDQAHPGMVLGALRRAPLYVEYVGDNTLPTLQVDEHTVVPVFSSPMLLASYLAALRPETDEMTYLAVPGSLLLDDYLPGEVGLLLDATSPHQLAMSATGPVNAQQQEEVRHG